MSIPQPPKKDNHRMKTEKRDFDKEAAAWDENPVRVKLAKDVAQAIMKQVALSPDMNVLDFGCGTGLLALSLLPFVRSVTGVDSSQGMLDILQMKIAKLQLNNLRPVLFDLDKDAPLTGNYDLIVSNMTLHHIKEVKSLLQQFYNITAAGGYLCLADLDLENGQFHADNTGVFHFGFDRTKLRRIFNEAGFSDVRDFDAAEVLKPGDNGEMKRFSVFLLIGKK
jgi:cyclopropane fatty-acyl-phospholipid synthase-like methyltransferase